MNQLFREKPPLELIDEILTLFGITNFNENYKFTREDIKKKDIIPKLLNMNLEKYYINCKFKKYFINLDEKKIITILRQLVRIYDYKINSIEKFSNNKKYLVYHLIKNNPTEEEPQKKVVLEFD